MSLAASWLSCVFPYSICSMHPTAIIADDEPRLAENLASRLRALWPHLNIVAIVPNGIAAVAAIAEHKPNFAFLDIRMPGLDGMQVAKAAPGTRVVFVTAYDEYAVSAFDNAAVDYLLKPISDARLAQCVARLTQWSVASVDSGAAAALPARPLPGAVLEWLTVRLGDTTRLVAVNEVLYFRSGDKYTEAVTPTEHHLIRIPLKELLTQLDQRYFAQIHRSVIVNLRKVERIERDLFGRSTLHLRDHGEVLSVSRNYLDQFKQM
jgi:DNA-binding LytR/AlgR family response regulator